MDIDSSHKAEDIYRDIDKDVKKDLVPQFMNQIGIYVRIKIKKMIELKKDGLGRKQQDNISCVKTKNV